MGLFRIALYFIGHRGILWSLFGLKSKLQVIFHFAVFFYYGYGDFVTIPVFTGIHNVLGKAADDPDIQRYVTSVPAFFTVWNKILQQVYFGCCCLSHLSHGFPFLIPGSVAFVADVVRRNILNSVLIPSSMVTAVNYWGVSSFSPDSVYAGFAKAYPQWINHSLHTFVVPVSLLELYLRASSGEATDLGSRKGWIMVNGYMTIYTAATAAHFLFTGTWNYPFYDSMSNWTRVGVTLLVYASSWLYYFAAIRLGKNVWGKQSIVQGAISLIGKLK